MKREEFDKVVEKTTDLILDKLSEADYANPGAEQQRRRMVIRSAVRDGILSLLFANAAGGAPQKAQAKGSRIEPLIESLHAWTGIPYPSGQHV
jgi:hypothetical protein